MHDSTDALGELLLLLLLPPKLLFFMATLQVHITE